MGVTVHSINFNNWKQPSGLYLDNNSNIITTAYELDKNQIISKHRLVFIIDKNSNSIFKKIDAGDSVDREEEIKFFDNKMIFCFGFNYKSLKVIEFE